MSYVIAEIQALGTTATDLACWRSALDSANDAAKSSTTG
jgi:hypothetical protein